MLLVAYEKSCGQNYLKSTLESALHSILSQLESANLSRAGIIQDNPNMTNDEIERKYNENKERMENACSVIFDTIFESKSVIPQSILRMCGYLAFIIEEAEGPIPSLKKPELARDISGFKGEELTSIFGSFLKKLNFEINGDVGEEQNQRETKVSTLKLYELTVSQKVVSSFFLLRFIVPAITSPETAGLDLPGITPNLRKGLVFCGKLMAALFNGVETGVKDESLIPFHEFLQSYRKKMHEFLAYLGNTDRSLVNQKFEDLWTEKKLNSIAANNPTIGKKIPLNDWNEDSEAKKKKNLSIKNILSSLSLGNLVDIESEDKSPTKSSRNLKKFTKSSNNLMEIKLASSKPLSGSEDFRDSTSSLKKTAKSIKSFFSGSGSTVVGDVKYSPEDEEFRVFLIELRKADDILQQLFRESSRSLPLGELDDFERRFNEFRNLVLA